MDWLKVTVRTNTAGADMVSEALMRAGASGTLIEDRMDAQAELENPAKWDMVDPALVEAMDEDVLVHAYLPQDASTLERVASLRATLEALTPDAIDFDAGARTLSVENVREEDWAENWKRYYKPFRAGRRLVVKPVWEPFAAGPDDRIVEIDPGMAFGNGTHETTYMCLELLESCLRPGDTVLDVGTGSGILALAAARLGASHALGVDIDPVAVRVARENIARNGLESVVEVRQGDLLQGLNVQADVVLANIIADAVILLSGAVRAHLKQGGAFLCSGIIRDREADVRAALQAAGFAVERAEYRGEWVALVAR